MLIQMLKFDAVEFFVKSPLKDLGLVSFIGMYMMVLSVPSTLLKALYEFITASFNHDSRNDAGMLFLKMFVGGFIVFVLGGVIHGIT